MPKSEDTWWDIDEKTSAPFLGAQIQAVLWSCALPFLRQFETEEDIKRYLRAATEGDMKHNYKHALTMLALDLLENKDQSRIDERIERARFLGKINLVHKPVIEADIQRVLQRCRTNT